MAIDFATVVTGIGVPEKVARRISEIMVTSVVPSFLRRANISVAFGHIMSRRNKMICEYLLSGGNRSAPKGAFIPTLVSKASRALGKSIIVFL
jgi:hypothetical protein